MSNILQEVLDSDDHGEDNYLSSDNSCKSCNNVHSISSESCEADKDSHRQSVTRVDSAGNGNSSVASSSVTELTEQNSSPVSLLRVLKAPKPSDLSRKHSVL